MAQRGLVWAGRRGAVGGVVFFVLSLILFRSDGSCQSNFFFTWWLGARVRYLVVRTYIRTSSQTVVVIIIHPENAKDRHLSRPHRSSIHISHQPARMKIHITISNIHLAAHYRRIQFKPKKCCHPCATARTFPPRASRRKPSSEAAAWLPPRMRLDQCPSRHYRASRGST